MPVTADNLRAFLNRDWAASRRSKDRAVAAHIAKRGVSAAFALSQALIRQAWPQLKREVQGRDDVAGLMQMKEKLARAAARRRRRR